MRIVAFAFCLACAVSAQDRRNTDVPGTETHFKMPAFSGRQEWDQHRGRLRSQILSAAGLMPMPEKTPLNPKTYKRMERDGYTIETLTLETMPGYFLGANLYRPAGRKGPFPAVLHPHGHWEGGRLENSAECSSPTLAVNLARLGFVVIAYDMAGYNDTKQTPHEFSGGREDLWAFKPMGLQLWNSTRVLDYIASLPDVDPKRIAMSGASGGGTQTFLLQAVDSRLAATAPVNMVSAIYQGGCVCENGPGLRLGTSNLEIAASMAPKPLLLVSATGDWTKNVPKDEYPAIRTIYSLFQKPDHVEVVQIDAPHNYNRQSREAVYGFLSRRLLDREGKFDELPVTMEKREDMLAFAAAPMPQSALNYGQILDKWVESAKRQTSETVKPAALRGRLRLVLGAEWPASVIHSTEHQFLSRPGAGDHVPCRFTTGKGRPVLYLHPDGIEGAQYQPRVKELIAQGRPVLLIDAFQTGGAKAKRIRGDTHFLTFNPSDDQARVQDIFTAVRFLDAMKRGGVDIEAEGVARWWALFAAAAIPAGVHFTAQPGEFPETDEALLKSFPVSNIQRAGGVSAALRLLAPAKR